MKRPAKLDPLAAFVRFLDVMIRAEATYANANRTMEAIARADFTRAEFATFNPQLFGRARGATQKDSGH